MIYQSSFIIHHYLKEGYAQENQGSDTLWKIVSHCHPSIDDYLFYFDNNERIWTHFATVLVQSNHVFDTNL
jgi:hypothetical protein